MRMGDWSRVSRIYYLKGQFLSNDTKATPVFPQKN